MPCPFTGPKCFVPFQIFWASPKIWLHLVPLQKLLCRHKNQFYWMQIIFLSGTKCLWLLQYVPKFLALHYLDKNYLIELLLGNRFFFRFAKKHLKTTKVWILSFVIIQGFHLWFRNNLELCKDNLHSLSMWLKDFLVLFNSSHSWL